MLIIWHLNWILLTEKLNSLIQRDVVIKCIVLKLFFIMISAFRGAGLFVCGTKFWRSVFCFAPNNNNNISSETLLQSKPNVKFISCIKCRLFNSCLEIAV